MRGGYSGRTSSPIHTSQFLSGLIGFCLFLLVAPVLSGCKGNPEKQLATSSALEVNGSLLAEESADQSCSYFYFMWGRSAELEENLEEAKEAYEKALVCDPGQEYIRKRLVGVLIQLDAKEEALAYLEQMSISGQEDVENLFMLGRLYAKLDQYEQAVETYRRILDMAPENQRALLFLGTLHAREENFDRGREVLERLVEINQQSFMGYNYLAKLYRELDLNLRAAEAYEKALDITWSTELAWEAVTFFEHQKMYERASVVYERLLEDNSANLKLRGRLIKLYLSMDEIDKAMEALKEMKAYMADTLQLDMTIGRFLLEQRKYKEAVKHFNRMLEEDRQTGAVRGFLALAYHGLDQDDKAKEVLQEIDASSPAYEDAVIMLTRIYNDEDRIERAIALLRKAVAGEESRRPSFYTVLAELYHEKGKSEDGMEVYREGVKHYPNNLEMRYNYAIYLDRMGRVDQAMENMKKVLTIDPEDPQALNYVGYTWADQGRNLDKALSYIKRALEARPESGFILDSLGWAHYRRGEYEEALKAMEKAAELEPEDPTINEHLGDVYLKVNEPEKAAAAYRKALKIYEEEEKRAAVRKKLDSIKEH